MRRWLALLVAATTSLVLIALLVPLALLVRTVAESGAVSEASGEADSVAVAVGTVDTEILRLTAERATHPVTVFLPDGQVIGAAASRSAAVELASRGHSVTAAVAGGREILVAVQGAPGGTAVVRVFLSDAELARGVAQVWAGLAALGLVLVGLGILVGDRLARAVIRPIASLAGVSHRLASGDLSARTVPGGPPEVHAVGLALNHLAGRITGLLAEERENVADLSHRLRTPLTALRLETESLGDPEGAARIEARVDALERAVTSVITEARQRARDRAECDAVAVTEARVAFWSVLAEDQSRHFTLHLASGPLLVAVAADELAACVDALLGNVFAHTPEGVPFTVRLEPAPGGALLTVADAGPGFATHTSLERGESGAGSTGLGLDIARRTAESSGGSLSLRSSPEGGASVILFLAEA
ncbi:Signal transduction histidine kinase [Streptosporangium subroseum]|uniref:Signal transduction histidine-protein kinase/phosphatase MprB n=1 Tax=Streptosporangium subroseum TaxID=106412 RepID=A0A239JQK2_9ACTN|nr:HAMP domain-containing sensor histidine kinase [Streptosporangium subroseum]SNT08151.1 Signal transduction histidine kinase [Streptosporangium subroseum]